MIRMSKLKILYLVHFSINIGLLVNHKLSLMHCCGLGMFMVYEIFNQMATFSPLVHHMNTR